MRSTQAVAVCLTAVISLLCGCGPGTKAPFNLSYTVPSAVYAKDVAIAANNPASSGGAATSYAVTPSLPAGMSFSLSSGVISGTPTAVSGAANYRVIAANSAGNTQTTLNISVNPSPLNASNLNLIFVVSGDLAYPGSGDINPVTANLTDQGLRRSLVMATYLQNQVLGGKNVTAIYAVEPMTHLQTTNDYPDVAAMGSIQQFAMLNQATVSSDANGGTPLAAGSFPLNVSYSTGPPPPGVVTPLVPCQACQGFDFNDEGRDNEALLTSIIKTNSPGFHVFSAPWEIVSSLLANISSIEGYNLPVPAGYTGPNDVYAISITPSGTATLATYNSNLNPSASYPVLPSTVVSNGCPAQTSPFKIAVTVGANGAIAPPGINKNETFYMVRHAEAHPRPGSSQCAQRKNQPRPGVVH